MACATASLKRNGVILLFNLQEKIEVNQTMSDFHKFTPFFHIPHYIV